MKAFEMPMGRATIDPGESFLDKRYTFVTVNAKGEGITCPAGAAPMGVIQEPNGVGEPAQTTVYGVSFIKLGGTVAAGAEIEVGEDGAAVALATGKSAGICLVGGESGDIGSVLLR